MFFFLLCTPWKFAVKMRSDERLVSFLRVAVWIGDEVALGTGPLLVLSGLTQLCSTSRLEKLFDVLIPDQFENNEVLKFGKPHWQQYQDTFDVVPSYTQVGMFIQS